VRHQAAVHLFCPVIEQGRKGEEIVYAQYVTSSFYFPSNFSLFVACAGVKSCAVMLFVLP
jgi:hypothetical protein